MALKMAIFWLLGPFVADLVENFKTRKSTKSDFKWPKVWLLICLHLDDPFQTTSKSKEKKVIFKSKFSNFDFFLETSKITILEPHHFHL